MGRSQRRQLPNGLEDLRDHGIPEGWHRYWHGALEHQEYSGILPEASEEELRDLASRSWSPQERRSFAERCSWDGASNMHDPVLDALWQQECLRIEQYLPALQTEELFPEWQRRVVWGEDPSLWVDLMHKGGHWQDVLGLQGPVFSRWQEEELRSILEDKDLQRRTFKYFRPYILSIADRVSVQAGGPWVGQFLEELRRQSVGISKTQSMNIVYSYLQRLLDKEEPQEALGSTLRVSFQDFVRAMDDESQLYYLVGGLLGDREIYQGWSFRDIDSLWKDEEAWRAVAEGERETADLFREILRQPR